MTRLWLWLWLTVACSHPNAGALAALASRVPVAIHSCPDEPPAPADLELSHLEPSDRIASVTVHGAAVELGGVTLATKPGALFDPSALRDDLHALWNRYRASRIGVTATRSPDGNALVFEVTPARPVIGVELDGVTRAEVPRLAALEGTLENRGRLARLVASTEHALRDRGYVHAHLRGTTRATCEGIVVRITGTVGRRFRVGAIRVIGAAAPVVGADLQDDLGHANVPGGVYWKSGLDDALARIVARDRALGYVDAVGTLDVHPDERTGRVDLVLWITDGPRYRIEVVVAGGTPEMRALVAARLAATGATQDVQVLAHTVALLDRPLAKLGGRVDRTDEKLANVLRVRLALAPLDPLDPLDPLTPLRRLAPFVPVAPFDPLTPLPPVAPVAPFARLARVAPVAPCAPAGGAEPAP